MRQRHAERFGHHLRGGGRAEELASAAGRGAGAAAEFGGVLERDLPWAKRAPMDLHACPASSPSSASSVTPPGTRTQGRSRMAASAIIIAGRPLSQVATPMHAARVGSERIRRRKTVAASLR